MWGQNPRQNTAPSPGREHGHVLCSLVRASKAEEAGSERTRAEFERCIALGRSLLLRIFVATAAIEIQLGGVSYLSAFRSSLQHRGPPSSRSATFQEEGIIRSYTVVDSTPG